MTRSNGLKLSKEHVNTNVRLHCYKNRVVSDWNSLPSYIVNASDVLTFKVIDKRLWAIINKMVFKTVVPLRN